MSRRKRTEPKNRRTGWFLLLGFVLALGFIAGPRLTQLIAGPPDFSGPGSGSVQIEVVEGDSIAKIGNVLKAAGVVKSVDAFTAAASANPDSKKIAPGFYEMLLGMRASDAIIRLLDPTAKVVYRVVIPEGKRAVDIYEILSEATKIPVAQFEQAANESDALPLPSYANGNVEGFLFPATYEFPPTVTAQSALIAMIEKFNAVSKQLNLEALSTTTGRSVYEILTIASILEMEGTPADYRKVSRVVYNRLSLPMKLEFDSTVNYGLGKTDVILTTELLSQENPYNSYLNFGLPPSPIGNPGVAAIEAALNPENGDWIYFITVNLETRETRFTSDYYEFLRWKDEFLAYCKQKPEICYSK